MNGLLAVNSASDTTPTQIAASMPSVMPVSRASGMMQTCRSAGAYSQQLPLLKSVVANRQRANECWGKNSKRDARQ